MTTAWGNGESIPGWDFGELKLWSTLARVRRQTEGSSLAPAKAVSLRQGCALASLPPHSGTLPRLCASALAAVMCLVLHTPQHARESAAGLKGGADLGDGGLGFFQGFAEDGVVAHFALGAGAGFAVEMQLCAGMIDDGGPVGVDFWGGPDISQ